MHIGDRAGGGKEGGLVARVYTTDRSSRYGYESLSLQNFQIPVLKSCRNSRISVSGATAAQRLL